MRWFSSHVIQACSSETEAIYGHITIKERGEPFTKNLRITTASLQAILPPPFGASSFSHTSLDPLMGTTQGPFEDSTQGLLEGSAPGLRKGSVQGLFEDSAQGPLDGSTQGPLEGSAPGSRKDSPQGPAEDSAQAFAVATKARGVFVLFFAQQMLKLGAIARSWEGGFDAFLL
eukprot:1136913-Pelagomonas_calceolata.AAC.4